MHRYANFGGDSNVVAYTYENGSITVAFGDGSRYVYTNASAGSENIVHMQRLAQAGQGLNSFINRVVRKRYARKIR